MARGRAHLIGPLSDDNRYDIYVVRIKKPNHVKLHIGLHLCVFKPEHPYRKSVNLFHEDPILMVMACEGIGREVGIREQDILLQCVSGWLPMELSTIKREIAQARAKSSFSLYFARKKSAVACPPNKALRPDVAVLEHPSTARDSRQNSHRPTVAVSLQLAIATLPHNGNQPKRRRILSSPQPAKEDICTVGGEADQAVPDHPTTDGSNSSDFGAHGVASTAIASSSTQGRLTMQSASPDLSAEFRTTIKQGNVRVEKGVTVASHTEPGADVRTTVSSATTLITSTRGTVLAPPPIHPSPPADVVEPPLRATNFATFSFSCQDIATNRETLAADVSFDLPSSSRNHSISESSSRATQAQEAPPKPLRALLDPQSKEGHASAVVDLQATHGGNNNGGSDGAISAVTAALPCTKEVTIQSTRPELRSKCHPAFEKCEVRIATGALDVADASSFADVPTENPSTATTIALSSNKTAIIPLAAGVTEETSRSTTVLKTTTTTAASNPKPRFFSVARPTGRDAEHRASTSATARATSQASLSTSTEQDRARLSQVYDALTQHVLAENDAARAGCKEVYDQIEQTKDTFHAVRQGIRQMYRALRPPNNGGDNANDDETDRKAGPIDLPHKIQIPAMDLDDAKCWTKISHAADGVRNQTKELRLQQSRLAAERDRGEASLTSLSETYFRWQARRETCMSRLLDLRKHGPLIQHEAKKPKAKRSLP